MALNFLFNVRFDQRGAAQRSRAEVGKMVVAGHAIGSAVLRHRGDSNAILQREAADFERREHRRRRDGRASGARHSGRRWRGGRRRYRRAGGGRRGGGGGRRRRRRAGLPQYATDPAGEHGRGLLLHAQPPSRPAGGDAVHQPPDLPPVRSLPAHARRGRPGARGGRDLSDAVERAARDLTIHSFKVLGMPEPCVVDVEVHCSSGTYIRSLADDLGRALGGSAHLRNLRRTAVSDFQQSEASPLEDVVVHPPITAVRTMSRVVADQAMQAMIKNGRELEKFDSPAPWVLVDENNSVLAIYEQSASGRAKPSVVMANAVS